MEASAKFPDLISSNLQKFRLRCLTRINYVRYNSKVLKIFFWGLLLSYGTVSKKIMLVYQCYEIGDMVVLRRSVETACYTSTWYLYNVISVTGIALFIFGVPMAFLQVLRRARNMDVNRKLMLCRR